MLKINIALTPTRTVLESTSAADLREHLTAAHVLAAIEPELARLTAAVKVAYATAQRRPARPLAQLRALPATLKRVAPTSDAGPTGSTP